MDSEKPLCVRLPRTPHKAGSCCIPPDLVGYRNEYVG